MTGDVVNDGGLNAPNVSEQWSKSGACINKGELGPYGVLPEGTEIHILPADENSEGVRLPSCMGESWPNDHPDHYPRNKLCEVGEGGLDSGTAVHDSTDPELICRQPDGMCGPCGPIS